jgi:hypothetical protein
VEVHNQLAASPVRDIVDARRQPRFKLEVDISIHSRMCGTLKGHTVDISESEISAHAEIGSYSLRTRGVGLYASVRSSDDLCVGSPKKRPRTNAVRSAKIGTLSRSGSANERNQACLGSSPYAACHETP